jgi:hypothetical protein
MKITTGFDILSSSDLIYPIVGSRRTYEEKTTKLVI